MAANSNPNTNGTRRARPAGEPLSNRVALFAFTEFGRRVKDNGSGGAAFAIGDPARGGVYGALVERWLGLDAKPAVGGRFEQPEFV